MNALRIAALFICGLGAALITRAAERTGPAPDDIIYPRGAESAPTLAGANDVADESAATGSAAANPFAPGPTPSLGGLPSTMGYLIAFGALIGGAWFLFRRGTLGRRFVKSEGRLRVLETKMLGNRQFLMVVEYDDAKILLGVCPGKIDYLTPLAGHPRGRAPPRQCSPTARDQW